MTVALSKSSVADQYLVRLASRQAALHCNRMKTASYQVNPYILESFANAFFLPYMQGRRVAFGAILKKLKELGKAFTKIPKLWEKLKALLGIESLTELPKVLSDLAKKGYTTLRKVVAAAFNKWPLHIYTVEKAKVLTLNGILEQFMAKFPDFKKWLTSHVKPKVDQLDHWLKENLPTLSKVLMIGIYFWIWFNVTEFEWDIRTLTDILTGSISLSDLLTSIPGSILGFLMNSLGFGTFTLLPAALAVRIAYLTITKYVSWDGKNFVFHQQKAEEDFA